MHEYSLEALSVQDKVLKRKDDISYRRTIIKSILGSMVFLVTVGLLVYCIHIGKEQIAFEIIKLVGIAILSGGGAYFYGKSVGAKEHEKSSGQSFTDYEEIKE